MVVMRLLMRCAVVQQVSADNGFYLSFDSIMSSKEPSL